MKTKQGSDKGQSLVELCASLVVCVPIILACIDASYIAMGASINDTICRDAARAAASGKPQVVNPSRHAIGPAQDSFLRAAAVIKAHNPSNLPIKVNEQPLVFETVRDIPPSNTGGAVDGEVEVKTTVLIMPPFLVNALLPSGVNLSSTHSIPYTYSVKQIITAAGG